jgi:integrase/recombinase XerD
MAQAKVITEQELKRALGIVAGRKHAARDRLALLLTHWAGMRVCEVATLTRGTVLGPAGEILDLIGGGGARGIARQAALAGFHELLGPSVLD